MKNNLGFDFTNSADVTVEANRSWSRDLNGLRFSAQLEDDSTKRFFGYE